MLEQVLASPLLQHVHVVCKHGAALAKLLQAPLAGPRCVAAADDVKVVVYAGCAIAGATGGMGKCIVQQLQATSFATVTAYQVVCCVCCAAAGATGGVGKRVVQQLLAQGRVVRALVRDVEKAKQLLVSAL